MKRSHHHFVRLNPKGTRTDEQDPHRRVLLIDDERALRDVVQVVLEHTGYTVVATSVQADAVSLLLEVAFDLVLTDSFSRSSSGALTESDAVLEAAGATPVVLFSAH